MDCLEVSNGAGVDSLNGSDDDVEMDDDDNVVSEGMKRLEKLHKKFEAYCKELVVFGFNSAGYDVKLIKKFLFKELCEHGQQPTFTVKKSGKYPCIKTEHLKFLDVLQFLAPGCNLKSFSVPLVFQSKKVPFLMTILPMLTNWMKPHHLPLILFTQPSRTVTSWKKSMLHFKNLSIKENLNKMSSKYYT